MVVGRAARRGDGAPAAPGAARRPVRLSRRVMGEDAYEQVLWMTAVLVDGCRTYDRFASLARCAGIVWG